MKKLLLLTCFLAFMSGILVQSARADVNVTVTGWANTTPSLSMTYTSLASAITALSGVTNISGEVILTCDASGAETAPAGGYVINFSAATTVANDVIIDGSSTTITASGAQTAGAINDAIFKIIGSDFVTLKNFTMLENAANTTIAVATNNMTEWGVALLYASLTNGAQNNTILNNTIKLNRTYLNTFGIYSNTRHSAADPLTAAEVTSAAGANSYTKVYGNIIQNVNYGIVFIGAGTTLAAIDNGNDIGGASATTGNAITNWGGGSALSAYISLTTSNYCIIANQQINDNVSYNTITSGTGVSTGATSHGGILDYYSVASPTSGTITKNLNNNTVTLNASLTTGGITGINSQSMTALSTATININNNSILNCSITGTATSAGMTALYNSSAPGTLNINNNIIRGNSMVSTTGAFTGIGQAGAVVTTANINNNQIGNGSGNAITLSAPVSNQVVGVNNTAIATTCALSINDNNFQGFSFGAACSGLFRCINNQVQALSATINNNNFNNITINSTAALGGYLIYCSSATPTVTVSGNYITTQFSNSNATGGTSAYAYYNGGSPTSGTSTLTNNKITNVTLRTTTGTSYGIYWVPGTGATCTHSVTATYNKISNLVNPGVGTTSQAASVYGLLVGYGYNNVIAYDTITNLTATGGSVIGLYGGPVSTNAAGTLSMYGNIVSNISTASVYSTTGYCGNAYGLYLAGGPATNNVYKNKIYDVSCSSTSAYTAGTAAGIVQAQATATSVSNIYNNIIGRIYSLNSTFYQSMIGIFQLNSVANTTNYYFNTVVLDGVCPIQSYCFYKMNATPNVNLRNNILSNYCTQGLGADVQMVYFFTGALGTTYLTSSNNNMLYCRAPSASNIIYADGAVSALTNIKQSLSDFQSFVGPTRENASKTENVPFLNTTTGASANYLHINPAIGTQVESGAVTISGILDDYDGNTRQTTPNFPDIGADEGAFTYAPPMTFVSETTTQNTSNTAPNLTNQQVIGIQVVTAGMLNPFTVSTIKVNANGSSDVADIVNAKIYYTGTSPVFSITGTLFGTVATPTLANFNVTGTQVLASGTNYFWLTFDVVPGATIGHVIDAECIMVVGNGTMGNQAPAITAPAGSRSIMGPLAGTYNIGTGGSKSASGNPITFEKVVRKVWRPVMTNQQVLGASTIPSKAHNAASVVVNGTENEVAPTDQVSTVRKMMEVEEVVYVPMENGKEYTGTLYPANSGSSKSNLYDPIAGTYTTITAAVNDLNIRGISAPVTFMLIDNTYPSETYPITFDVINSLIPSLEAPVTIKPDAGVTPLVSGSNDDCLFKLNGTDYITFDGSNNGTNTKDLTIKNNSTDGSSKIIWIGSASSSNGATNNTIKNCNIVGNQDTWLGVVTSSGTSAGGVAEAQNNNTTIQNNTITGCFYGVACVGPTGDETGLHVVNNYLGSVTPADYNLYRGVGLYQQGTAVISDNTITGIGSDVGGEVAGIQVAGTANGVQILRNTISNIKNTNVDGYAAIGIELSSSSSTALVLVANNAIYDVAGYGYLDGVDNGNGILVLNGGGYSIYYNSVSMNTNQAVDGYPAAFNVYDVAVANALDVKNNIFANLMTFGTEKYAVICSVGDTVFSSIDYNDYYTTGTNLGFLDSDAANLTEWQALTLQDSHSISGNPLYTSTTYLMPQSGSPVIGAALPLTGIVDDDILSVARNATAPTQGAYEFAVTSKTLTLTQTYLESLYGGEGTLRPTNNCDGLQFQGDTAEVITVELRNSDDGTLESTGQAALMTDGSAVVSVPPDKSGLYYVYVVTRNCLTTSSAEKVDCSGSTMTYSFNPVSQAWGDNQQTTLDGTAAFFAGDITQDGLVDSDDLAMIGNRAAWADCGYMAEDLTGDGLVDSDDLAFCGNNAAWAIGVNLPF
jgi:hypothetical protein